MRFAFYRGDIENCGADLLGLGIFMGEKSPVWTEFFDQLDHAVGGFLRQAATEENFTAKSGQSVILNTCEKIGDIRRIVLVGLGKRETCPVSDTRRYGAAVFSAGHKTGAKKIAVALPPFDTYAIERSSQFLAEGVALAAYRFDRFISEPDARRKNLRELKIIIPDKFSGGPPDIALARARVVIDAVTLARDLVNEPPGVMTPKKLAECAASIAKKNELECRILVPRDIERQKMRLFLAVAAGSTEQARFIHLTYKPKGKRKKTAKYVLVGKGVTFDSGGLSLKPSAGMTDMKCDMAGAATVLACMQGIAQLGSDSEVHAIVAATENMPSGSAYKLGDIICGMSGKSVEIVNTDAEGRLTLADALTYACKLKPTEILDFATLTGACMVALGPHMAGVMGNSISLVERFVSSARNCGEEVWSLPLPERLRSQLESDVADLKNSGERWGGALSAGLFLKEFVGETPWIHVDIAGPAFADKTFGHIPKGGTGFGVATLLEYLLSRDRERTN